MAETSVSTLRMRSPSTITMALVQTFPWPSTSFPKRSALTFPGLFGVCCAKILPGQQSSSERDNQLRARSFKGVHLRSKIGGRGRAPGRAALVIHRRKEINWTNRKTAEDGQKGKAAILLSLGGSCRARRCRLGRRNAGDFRPQAELLQRQGIELACRLQPVSTLKALHRGYRGGIPLARGIALEGAIAGQGALDFGDAVRSGSLLSAHMVRPAEPAPFLGSGRSVWRGWA